MQFLYIMHSSNIQMFSFKSLTVSFHKDSISSPHALRSLNVYQRKMRVLSKVEKVQVKQVSRIDMRFHNAFPQVLPGRTWAELSSRNRPMLGKYYESLHLRKPNLPILMSLGVSQACQAGLVVVNDLEGCQPISSTLGCQKDPGTTVTSETRGNEWHS